MRRLGVFLVALALIAAACSDDPASETTTSTSASTTTTTVPAPTTSTAASGQRPVGGSVTIGLDLRYPPNPLIAYEGTNHDASRLKPLAHAGVWQYDAATGELLPDLVVDLPSTTNGGLALQDDGTVRVHFEIHPDARWSDGRSVTGEDFRFTYEAVVEAQDRLDGARAAGAPLVHTECDADFEISMRGADTYRAVVPGSFTAGDKTVDLVLEAPGAYTAELFEVVVPAHAVAGTDIILDWNERLWPTATGFEVASWDGGRGEAVFRRNEYYWRTDPETGQALPYLDEVVVSALPEAFAELIPEPYPWDDDGDPGTPPVAVEGVSDLVDERGACIELDGIYGRLGIDGDRRNAMSAALNAAIFDAGWSLVSAGVTPVWGGEGAAPADADVTSVQTGSWESVAFNFGDGRLRANPDSLIEHLEFRRAIVHALDRERMAAEAYGDLGIGQGFLLDSVLDVFSPTAGGEGVGQYGYDPDEAGRLLASLCERLGRDCTADPPRVVVTSSDVFRFRSRIADLMAEMLREVGIDVEVVREELSTMLFGCGSWEVSTWTWLADPGFRDFADMYEILDPGAGAAPGVDGSSNYYAWGTDAVSVDRAARDLPPLVDDAFRVTPDCDESEVWDIGPSSVRDEFTERFAGLMDQSRLALPGDLFPIVREMDEILADQVPIVPLFARPASTLVDTDVLGGYDPARASGNGLETFWNVDRWYRKDL
jgi:ABC-type transport system substrate-binding protein